MPSLSLIVAVFNKPRELKLLLAACSRQSFRDFEIVIADDGSGSEVADVITQFRETSMLAVTHVWHEDTGWRKNVILNRAIENSQSDYLVFIDGDCIPHSLFLEDHWAEHRQHVVLCGRRAEMSERWTRELNTDTIMTGAFETIGAREWWDSLRKRAVRIEDGLRFKNTQWQKLLHSTTRGMLGSNFSLHKADIEAINGFDELYDGPGCGEDSDVQFRLSLNSVQCKPLRNRAIQFHMHHPLTRGSEACRIRFEAVKQLGIAWCEKGLRSHTPNNPEKQSL